MCLRQRAVSEGTRRGGQVCQEMNPDDVDYPYVT
jgi:hypothetical protein